MRLAIKAFFSIDVQRLIPIAPNAKTRLSNSNAMKNAVFSAKPVTRLCFGWKYAVRKYTTDNPDNPASNAPIRRQVLLRQQAMRTKEKAAKATFSSHECLTRTTMDNRTEPSNSTPGFRALRMANLLHLSLVNPQHAMRKRSDKTMVMAREDARQPFPA